jgi:cellulose synthase/poly-beta-1,6-N-acetylglucosamine synthase-like glycosyltransferase
MKASVIVPILYTEPRLRETLEGVARQRGVMDLEIVLVVDVPDPGREAETRTAVESVAADVGAVVEYRVGRRGFGSALRSGFARATGEAVIPVMGDACDDPDDIPRLMEKLEEGWDVVAGSRYVRGGRIVGNTLKQWMSKIYGVLVRLVGGPEIHDVSNAFKAYRRPVVDAVDTVADSYDISVELTVKAHMAGFTITEIPTTWTNRQAGQSHFRFWHELRRYARWLWLAATATRRAHPVPSPTTPDRG